MPSWTDNKFSVFPTREDSTSKKQYKDFRKKMFVKGKDDYYFDFNKIIPMPKEFSPDLVSSPPQNDVEKKRAAKNIKKYGYATWYEWCCEEWGTKWNACNTYIDWDEDFNIYFTFQTAWSPPEPVIKALVEKYKLLTFSGQITEESNAFMGVIGGKNGVYIREFIEPIS